MRIPGVGWDADGESALGLASPAVHALCDACVVAAIREHKVEMMSQFKQLKEEIASGLKTVRQSIAQVERICGRKRYQPPLPARGCETATAGGGRTGAGSR